MVSHEPPAGFFDVFTTVRAISRFLSVGKAVFAEEFPLRGSRLNDSLTTTAAKAVALLEFCYPCRNRTVICDDFRHH